MKRKEPLVTIIILNWNKPHLTLACLRSLCKLTYSNFQVIVLDNNSKDTSLEQLRAVLPELNYQVELIANERNLGFAEGNNVGIRRALEKATDYVLLLNDDTEVAPDFLEALVKMAELDGKIGIVGPKIYYYDEPTRIWSAGGLFGRGGRTEQLGVNQFDSPEFNQLRKVDYVTGCAMLVKRQVIEQVGMLDSRFFAYYEEVDWCGRAAKAGYTIYYVPQSVVWHKISLKARDMSPLYIYLMTRNRLLFMRNLGLSPLVIWYSLLTVDLRTILAWSVRRRHYKSRPLRRWRWQGVLDYLQGHFGEPKLG